MKEVRVTVGKRFASGADEKVNQKEEGKKKEGRQTVPMSQK